MKTNRIASYTALFAACLLFPAANAGAQQMKTLPGHVPAAISRLHLKSTGQLAPDYKLNLAVGLPVRNTEALSNLLEQVYDPASTNYHRFLTPAEFAARFGPSAEDYQKVMNFATNNGLSIVGTHANRLVLDLSGKASDVQKAFNVNLKTYHDSTRDRDFYAPDTDPTVSSSLPVLHVHGLDNYATPQSYLHRQPVNSSQAVSSGQPIGALQEPSAAHPATGTAPQGGYWGQDFRNAYVPGTTLTGSGQNVALLEFDGFYPSDIAAYAKSIGLTNPPNVVVVPVDGGIATPGPDNDEVSLDIEMVMSMSPGVSNIYVYEGGGDWDDLISKIATDDLAKQVSSSWGLISGPDPIAEEIYQQMDLQGQSVFQASGDQDAYTGEIPFPSDSLYQTVVGATTLTMNGAGVSYASETVWNWGIEYGINGVGSSGGVSTSYLIPSWQTNLNFAFFQGSSTMRNLPDVALTGDNVWVDYGDGQSGIFGGTSCAAPLWAGFTALVNQQATNNDHPPVGFLNPTFYRMALGTTYTNLFHDVTTGNNTWSGSPNEFYAGSNYDLCTGLGTPNGTNLINALAPTTGVTNYFTHLSPPLPPYGTNLAALNGGNPNGNWFLFVQDDQIDNSGYISNGWFVTITSANPIGYVADDGLTMSASATNLPLNGDVTFNISVVNYGPSTSSNVLVSDLAPNGFTVVSANPEGIYSLAENSETWNVGNLALNQATNVSLTLQAPSAPVQFAENYASVSAGTPDQNSADNSAYDFVNVISAAAPQLGSVQAGPGGTFQLTVTNPSGLPVVIQASTNLVDWVNVWTNDTSTFTYTDTVTAGIPDRFYRAILQ